MAATQNQALIEPLVIELNTGRSISHRLVQGFVCCRKPIPYAKVFDQGSHGPGDSRCCLWRYSIHCQECNYETSLAKCIPGYECQCGK